jgi:hypothetical protein
MFHLWQVLFATSRLTGRVPMPWMEHGTGCRHLGHSNLYLAVRMWVGPIRWSWTGLAMYPSVIRVPMSFFAYAGWFDFFIMDRALWRRPPAGFLAPRLV